MWTAINQNRRFVPLFVCLMRRWVRQRGGGDSKSAMIKSMAVGGSSSSNWWRGGGDDDFITFVPLFIHRWCPGSDDNTRSNEEGSDSDGGGFGDCEPIDANDEEVEGPRIWLDRSLSSLLTRCQSWPPCRWGSIRPMTRRWYRSSIHFLSPRGSTRPVRRVIGGEGFEKEDHGDERSSDDGHGTTHDEWGSGNDTDPMDKGSSVGSLQEGNHGHEGLW